MAAPIRYQFLLRNRVFSSLFSNHMGSMCTFSNNTKCSRHGMDFLSKFGSCFTVNSRFFGDSDSTPVRRLRNRRSRMLSSDLSLPEKSQEFASHLRSGERETLFLELSKYQKSKGEDQNSSSTGLPEESETDSVPTPTTQQLRMVAFSNLLPFLGFGFFDNSIMIIAGDYIDVTIGATLTISTMAAAGFGNMISDVAGISLAGTVEAMVSKVGVQVPVLTPQQQDMTRTRWTASIARVVGISVGCLLGMFPLLILSTKEDKENEEEKKKETV